MTRGSIDRSDVTRLVPDAVLTGLGSRVLAARLLRLCAALVLGLSFFFTQVADAAGAEQQPDVAAPAGANAEGDGPPHPPGPPTEPPGPPPDVGPPTEPTEPPVVVPAPEPPAPPEEPPTEVTEPPEVVPAPETTPPSEEPTPAEPTAPPEEPAPGTTLPSEEQAPTEPTAPPEDPAPTEPTGSPATTGEESPQPKANSADSPGASAGASGGSAVEGSGGSAYPGAAQPAPGHSTREPVSQPIAAAHEARSPRSKEAAAAIREDARPTSNARAPVALVLEQTSSMRADIGGCGEDCADVVSASAASVIAIASPRIPTTVSMAVEFGKAGHGWAGAIVFNLWLRRQLRERRMSQRQLAHLSGVNHSTISRLLAGDRIPSLETATKLARALRIPNEDIAAELGFVTGRPAMPTQRVEAALRGDETLDDNDVRELMAEYIARRRRLTLRTVDSGTAARRSPATSTSDPPA